MSREVSSGIGVLLGKKSTHYCCLYVALHFRAGGSVGPILVYSQSSIYIQNIDPEVENMLNCDISRRYRWAPNLFGI